MAAGGTVTEMTDRNTARIPLELSYADPAAVIDAWPSLEGKELLQAISDGTLPLPPIMDVLKIGASSAGEGWVEFVLDPQPYMLNLAGTVHGGVLATLLDTVLTCALVTLLPRGRACTTVDFQVRFFRPLRANAGRVVARGEVVNAGKTLGTTQASARDAEGRLIAHATSTLAIADAAAFLSDRRA